MSEVQDNTGQVRRPRNTDGGAPVTGALAIILAAVAVVAGFFILDSINDDSNNSSAFPGSGGNGEASATTIDPDGTTIPTLPPTTTAPALVTAGASVLVANANGVNGSAGTMTRALESGPGFTMVEPTNASSSVGDIDESVIYYDETSPAAKSVAESVARALGGVGTIAPLGEETPPTRDGTVNGAGVLLILGNDKAGKTLEELNPADAAATAVTSPPVAGATTATTTG